MDSPEDPPSPEARKLPGVIPSSDPVSPAAPTPAPGAAEAAAAPEPAPAPVAAEAAAAPAPAPAPAPEPAPIEAAAEPPSAPEPAPAEAVAAPTPAAPSSPSPIPPSTRSTPTQPTQKPKPRSRLRRFAPRALAVSIFGVLALWIAIQRVPWLGPLLADGARSVLGPSAVAWLEDTAYGAQDALNRWRYKDAAPKEYWEGQGQGQTPPAVPQPLPAATDAGLDDAAADAAPRKDANFPPAAVTPPFPAVAGKTDGVWLPIADDVAPSETPVLAKTIIHPDDKRTYAAVAVVAIDVRRVRIRSIAGTEEPANPQVPRKDRPGKIPASDHPKLVAAFNGGWQAIHGHFGMMVQGLEILPPKAESCTVALMKDDTIRIGSWPALAGDRDKMTSFRQTPPCLYEGGTVHKALTDGSKSWGAAVDGATVIRRSGVGISKDGNTLYYASGDGLTALTLAQALGAVGSHSSAELDVNWAFPRFLFYVHPTGGSGEPQAKSSLIPCTYKPNEHVGQSYYRDYFYVVRE